MPIPAGGAIGTPDLLATFLGVPVDNDRATLFLSLAQQVCESVVSPVPVTALPVILSIAARGYTNPEAQTSETVGSSSTTWSAAGVYLLRNERLQLKTLAGRGGAFTIDPTPTDAGTDIPPWSENVTYLSGVPVVEEPVE